MQRVLYGILIYLLSTFDSTFFHMGDLSKLILYLLELFMWKDIAENTGYAVFNALVEILVRSFEILTIHRLLSALKVY